MVFQRRKDSSRHSSIQAGSPFFLEMKATISSLRPFGAFTLSMLVSKPYLYWSTSIFLTWSMVSWTAGMPLHFLSQFLSASSDLAARVAAVDLCPGGQE